MAALASKTRKLGKCGLSRRSLIFALVIHFTGAFAYDIKSNLCALHNSKQPCMHLEWQCAITSFALRASSAGLDSEMYTRKSATSFASAVGPHNPPIFLQTHTSHIGPSPKPRPASLGCAEDRCMQGHCSLQQGRLADSHAPAFFVALEPYLHAASLAHCHVSRPRCISLRSVQVPICHGSLERKLLLSTARLCSA